MIANYDPEVVNGFGDEWEAFSFNSENLDPQEVELLFSQFFDIFPWEKIDADSIGFDLGCGTGRWVNFIAPKVKKIICIDASSKALEVAKRNLSQHENCEFHLASVENMPIEDSTMDFGYSVGVLHHIPDTMDGIKSCTAKLKPGAPFLVYLYYAFDNKPLWFRYIWKLSDIIRRIVCRLPFKLKYAISQFIALTIYYPLAKTALLLEKLRININSFPLSEYRSSSFYAMRSGSLDRFGTKIEKRFTRKEIKQMMESAGLINITFSETPPYWKCVGIKQ